MATHRRRKLDHDECTRLYIREIEQVYGLELELSLSAAPGQEHTSLQNMRIFCVSRNDSPIVPPELLAVGKVNTGDNKRFNLSVRYLLTVAMLRVMEHWLL